MVGIYLDTFYYLIFFIFTKPLNVDRFTNLAAIGSPSRGRLLIVRHVTTARVETLQSGMVGGVGRVLGRTRVRRRHRSRLVDVRVADVSIADRI